MYMYYLVCIIFLLINISLSLSLYIHILRIFFFLIDCLLLAFDAHMFSHTGYEPETKAQCPKAAAPQDPAQQL